MNCSPLLFEITVHSSACCGVFDLENITSENSGAALA